MRNNIPYNRQYSMVYIIFPLVYWRVVHLVLQQRFAQVKAVHHHVAPAQRSVAAAHGKLMYLPRKSIKNLEILVILW